MLRGQMHAACMATGKLLHPEYNLRAVKACILALKADGQLSPNAGMFDLLDQKPKADSGVY